MELLSNQESKAGYQEGTLPESKGKGYKKMGVRKRDSQRSKVYDWEEMAGLWDEKNITQQETIELFNAVVTHYGYDKVVYKPKLVFNSKLRAIAGKCSGNNIICLNPDMLKVHVVLHELAHAFTNVMYGIPKAGHGEHFVMVLLTLYTKYRVIKPETHIQYLIDEGVKIARFEDIKYTEDMENVIMQYPPNIEYQYSTNKIIPAYRVIELGYKHCYTEALEYLKDKE